MADKGWNNLGQDLNKIIEDAVHMGNFGHLNDTITNTVRKAFQGFDGGDAPGNGGWDFNLSGQKPQAAPSGQQAHGNEDSRQKYGSYRYHVRPYANMQAGYFAKSGKRRGGAIAMLVGGILLLMSSIGPLGMGIFGSLIGLYTAATTSFGVYVVMAVLGAFLTVKGSRTLALAKRFDQYVRSLNGRTYGDIKALSADTHRDEAVVVKDIRKMLERGWFLQGHLDQQETCLMVSHEAYRQYMKALEGAKQQEAEARRQREEEEQRGASLAPEAKAVIEKGHEYIRQIRASNDAIPGEDVSEKIYHMELLVKRIFQQVEAHPENVSDLRKLMEYYLPMTIKLLKAYEELEQQPVQGDNIISSKREIEGTLDTLNGAFEKLLDNLFQDTAWDVSADISVLQTMLAQEGLMEDGFPKNKKA